MWQDKMRWLAAQGDEFQFAPVFKTHAFRTLMIGRSKVYFVLWDADKDHTGSIKLYK